MALTVYRLDRPGADRLLVLLHGWSAEQHHLAAYVPLVDPEERFTAVCPRGLHDLPDGDGASWYDRTGGVPEASSFVAALDIVTELVDEELARLGVGPERCVVGGFSQGGFLALALATRQGAPRFAGVWAMCCASPDVDGVDLAPAAVAGRALVQYGTSDLIITPGRTRAAASDLEAAGWEVRLRGYEMAHSQTIEMMIDAREWLADTP